MTLTDYIRNATDLDLSCDVLVARMNLHNRNDARRAAAAKVELIRRANAIIVRNYRAAMGGSPNDRDDDGNTIPLPGDTIRTLSHTYVARRVEPVNAYGRRGYRVYFDLDGRRIYEPMSMTEWRAIARDAMRQAWQGVQS